MKIEFEDMKETILNEIPYIGVKGYSHNIISLELRLVSEHFSGR